MIHPSKLYLEIILDLLHFNLGKIAKTKLKKKKDIL